MPNTDSKKERPLFLTIICILSFVSLGLNTLSSLLFAPFGGMFKKFVPIYKNVLEDEGMYDDMPEAFVDLFKDLFDAYSVLLENLTPILLVSALLYLIALYGVILMWKLNKNGFYLYTGAKVILVLLPIVFLGINFLSFFAIIFGSFFSAIFIVLYALNLKHMK